VREHVKQAVKNSVYRAIGEAASRIGSVDGNARVLRVLMYHKVNDLPGNRMSVPTALFEEQMAQLAQLGYRVVDLDAVLACYLEGMSLPERAVLVTFDDGYRDTLLSATPILERHGYPAVQFVPTGYVGTSTPLPHERALAQQGILNPTLDWDEVRQLESHGVRVESHGISHTPLSRLGTREAEREVASSKDELEERLGRPVRAFSYVKGSRADYAPAHVRLVERAGYDLAFTTVSGANSRTSDRLQLRRYNVEPFPARTFELVLEGACDAISLKDTVTGTQARRLFNAVLGTSS
jgi:peptidoglycan/xylan/chitin deacetylase (PgdA/CDA1 family)